VIPYWLSNDRATAFLSWDQDNACGCSGTGGSSFGGGIGGGIRVRIVEGVLEIGGVIDAVINVDSWL